MIVGSYVTYHLHHMIVSQTKTPFSQENRFLSGRFEDNWNWTQDAKGLLLDAN